jgi:hypothetical protein
MSLEAWGDCDDAGEFCPCCENDTSKTKDWTCYTCGVFREVEHVEVSQDGLGQDFSGLWCDWHDRPVNEE